MNKPTMTAAEIFMCSQWHSFRTYMADYANVSLNKERRVTSYFEAITRLSFFEGVSGYCGITGDESAADDMAYLKVIGTAFMAIEFEKAQAIDNAAAGNPQ